MTYIFTALVAGVIGAYGMYLLCTEKERRNYEDYQHILEQLHAEVQEAKIAGKNAIAFNGQLSQIVEKNRNELDDVVPEFRKMKHWMYEYVSYRPALLAKGKEQ